MEIKDTPAARDAAIACARHKYCKDAADDVDIDDDARVSFGEEGVWVQAWVWCPNVTVRKRIRYEEKANEGK